MVEGLQERCRGGVSRPAQTGVRRPASFLLFSDIDTDFSDTSLCLEESGVRF